MLHDKEIMILQYNSVRKEVDTIVLNRCNVRREQMA